MWGCDTPLSNVGFSMYKNLYLYTMYTVAKEKLAGRRTIGATVAKLMASVRMSSDLGAMK